MALDPNQKLTEAEFDLCMKALLANDMTHSSVDLDRGLILETTKWLTSFYYTGQQSKAIPMAIQTVLLNAVINYEAEIVGEAGSGLKPYYFEQYKTFGDFADEREARYKEFDSIYNWFKVNWNNRTT